MFKIFKTKKLLFSAVLKKKTNSTITIGTPFVFNKNGRWFKTDTLEEVVVFYMNFQDFLNKKNK